MPRDAPQRAGEVPVRPRLAVADEERLAGDARVLGVRHVKAVRREQVRVRGVLDVRPVEQVRVVPDLHPRAVLRDQRHHGRYREAVARAE